MAVQVTKPLNVTNHICNDPVNEILLPIIAMLFQRNKFSTGVSHCDLDLLAILDR